MAFGLGLLTVVFAFYAKFIRPSLEWRKDLEAHVDTLHQNMKAHVDKVQLDLEARVDKLQMRIEMHSETDTKLLAAVQSMGRDIGEIKTQVAVLKERSQRWSM